MAATAGTAGCNPECSPVHAAGTAGHSPVHAAVAGAVVPVAGAKSTSRLGQRLPSETTPISRLAPLLSATGVDG